MIENGDMDEDQSKDFIEDLQVPFFFLLAPSTGMCQKYLIPFFDAHPLNNVKTACDF